MSDSYETLLPFMHGGGEDAETLAASYTASNGIRIMIMNGDLGPDWAVFDLTTKEAETLGKALLRWSRAAAKAEGEV